MTPAHGGSHPGHRAGDLRGAGSRNRRRIVA